jgi:transcriptional regulator with XRE-family HTH domain
VDSLEEWLTQPDGMATRLRALRVRAGLSGKQLADDNGWYQSKVSRIENGKQMPSDEDIRAWARSCGAGEAAVAELLAAREEARVAHATFPARMRSGQVKTQQTYNDLVQGATLVRHFETVFVPGLLQIPEYARRIFTEMVGLHGLDVDDIEASVAVRMQRQPFVYDPAKRFEFLLAEPVLRFLLVPPAVMRTQLDRLQTVIGLDRVRFGIVPEGVVLSATPQNSVQIYAGDETVAVVETFIGETWHRGREADDYGRALDLMWAEAVEGEDARRLIVQAAQALPKSS